MPFFLSTEITISAQVSDLLETSPILWIRSKIWFQLLSRRLNILYEAHGKLWSKFPQNYGVASGLFAFLMQSVIFTPPKVNWYVREALEVLNYKRNCDTFGMFFIPLKKPEYPWSIEDLPDIDIIEIVRELKVTSIQPRQPQRDQRNILDNEERYPLGEAPTWKQISSSLQSDPTVLIPRWEVPEEMERYTDSKPGTTERYATNIFIAFTCHLWIFLNPSWRIRPENPINPATLPDALRCWSVDAVLGEIKATFFKPCHSGLEGGPGRPAMSFSERRKIYFPVDEAQKLPKAWKTLTQSPGYISKYLQVRKKLDQGAKALLDEHLEELLGLCQCLPDSAQSQSSGRIWRVERQRIVVLTNPNFYQLKKIGQKPSKTHNQGRKAKPAHRNARSTAVAMMVNEDIPEDVAERAYQTSRRQKSNQKKRSAKSKNYRKPPQKKMIHEMHDSDKEEDGSYDGGDDDEEEDGSYDGGDDSEEEDGSYDGDDDNDSEDAEEE